MPKISGERQRRTGQTAISPAQFRRRRGFGFPSPHHAAGALASEEVPSHLVMRAREKHPVHHVSDAALESRIGAIEGELPLLPAEPDHGAPSFHHGIVFGHKHWRFSMCMTIK